MTVPERVEDTRTLKPGDRVRVVIEGKLMETSASPLDASSLLDSNGDRVWLNLTRPGFVVYRLPKPLPPEPPVGSEVLNDRGQVWTHSEDGSVGWYGPGGWAAWSHVLSQGPVRLLGDPIEAPR